MPPREIRVQDIDPINEVIPFTYEITAYGADYPVDGLVKRLENGDIRIPEFQRSFVWSRGQADRFVESLLLGLPVPGIFLATEAETRRLLVVDGQQRLTSLRRFYDGIWEDSAFRLKSVQPRFQGASYATLDQEDRRRLDDAILHATVVRQEQPSEDQSSIYFVFERLNTGGTPLQPQEIRSAIYRGELLDLLREFVELPEWQIVYGPPSGRMKDQELILRFFALLFHPEPYEQPMKRYLNRYMAHNRHLRYQSAEALREEFAPTVGAVAEALGRRAFRIGPALNAAVFDSVMVGVARRLRGGPIESLDLLSTAYERLLADPDFQKSTRRSTANEQNVATRLDLATQAFAQVR